MSYETHSETITHEGIEHRIRILSDDDAPNPREEYDNLSHMVTWHRNYRLGDEQPSQSPDDWLEAFKENHKEGEYIMQPLYLYDHSGITISTSAFSCAWDSGQIGYVYLTKEAAEKELSCEAGWETAAKNRIEGDVQSYDDYLTGNVWGYVVESRILEDDSDWSDEESCWGFIGDYEYCLEEAKGLVNYQIAHMPSQAERVAGINI